MWNFFDQKVEKKKQLASVYSSSPSAPPLHPLPTLTWRPRVAPASPQSSSPGRAARRWASWRARGLAPWGHWPAAWSPTGRRLRGPAARRPRRAAPMLRTRTPGSSLEEVRRKKKNTGDDAGGSLCFDRILLDLQYRNKLIPDQIFNLQLPQHF